MQGLGNLRRGIEQQRQASIFDAANRAALEPQQRLTSYGNMLAALMPRNVSTTQYQTGAGPSAAEGILQMSSGMGPRLFGAQQGGGQTLSNLASGIGSIFNMFNPGRTPIVPQTGGGYTLKQFQSILHLQSITHQW